MSSQPRLVPLLRSLCRIRLPVLFLFPLRVPSRFKSVFDLARIHQTLRVTPATAVSISDHLWNPEEIIGLLE